MDDDQLVTGASRGTHARHHGRRGRRVPRRLQHPRHRLRAGRARPTATSAPRERANDYLADWEAQRTRKFFGVPGVGAQDKAITESQACSIAARASRSRRYGIIRVRKRLLDAALALREGRVARQARSRNVSRASGLRAAGEGGAVGGGRKDRLVVR